MFDPTTTWTIVNAQLDLFLSDEELEAASDLVASESHPEALRIDGWNWAQRLLASHTPRQVETVLTVNSDGRSCELPDDYFDVCRVWFADTQRFAYHKTSWIQGETMRTNQEIDRFWIWGRKLLFDRTIETDEATLYYWAYWPEVHYRVAADDTLEYVAEEIIVPPWSFAALMHLTAAIVLQPGAISAARIRNWNMKVDSGTPEENSRAAQAREHWRWWRDILSSVPPQNRSGG
jgi:hypothetical protein